MALTKQALKGQIVITAGTNDTLHWNETTGGPAHDLSVAITAATYYPDALASEIGSAMTTTSAASGDSITYTCTIDNDTGIPTISASTGDYYPKITSTETQKLLTGGDQADGTRGDNHFGFNVDFSYPSAGDAVGDAAHSNAWYPDQPKRSDNDDHRKGFAIESTSFAGNVKAYQFAPNTRGNEDTATRTLAFEYLSQASRDQFEDEFWQVYANAGNPNGRFRFYNDRSTSSYTEYGLTGDSLNRVEFSRTAASLARWSCQIQMKRYVA